MSQRPPGCAPTCCIQNTVMQRGRISSSGNVERATLIERTYGQHTWNLDRKQNKTILAKVARGSAAQYGPY